MHSSSPPWPSRPPTLLGDEPEGLEMWWGRKTFGCHLGRLDAVGVQAKMQEQATKAGDEDEGGVHEEGDEWMISG